LAEPGAVVQEDNQKIPSRKNTNDKCFRRN